MINPNHPTCQLLPLIIEASRLMLSIAAGFIIGILTVCLGFLRVRIETKKLQLEREKLERQKQDYEKNNTRIWLPKDTVEVIRILNELNKVRLSFPYRHEDIFDENDMASVALTVDYLGQIKKDKVEEVISFLSPLYNSLICYNLTGKLLSEIIDDVAKTENKIDLKFVYPAPEIIFDNQPPENSRPKEEKSESSNGYFDLCIDPRKSQYESIKTYFSNIITIIDKFDNYKGIIWFIKKKPDIEFIVSGKKIAVRENKDSEWELFDNTNKLRPEPIFDTTSQIIDEIKMRRNIFRCEQLNIPKLLEKTSRFYGLN